MSLDREKELIEGGYERVRVASVMLPHTVWKLDIDIEFDRPLTLAEETVLRLVAAGVPDPEAIARLMGVDEGVIVAATIVNLLRRGLLGQVDVLTVMPLGRQALSDQRLRASKSYTDVEVRHDPYGDVFLWGFDGQELKDARDVKNLGHHVLPAPQELPALDVDRRHEEVQTLLNRFGFPFDSPEVRKNKVQRDIVRLRARHGYPAWRPAELGVWYHADRDDWQWVLRYFAGEERAVSEVLRKMQADGAEILPLDDRVKEPVSTPVTDQVKRAADSVRQSPRSQIIQTDQHRAALKEAILDARRELVVVSPWLTTAAVDGELESWFRQALDTNRELRIVIGYGIEPETGKGDWKSRDQRSALARLNQVGLRYRGRLRTEEIGFTHEKVVICDRRYAIITSFNWLSFKPQPNKGVRREIGTRVEDKTAVEELRGSLAPILRL